MITDIANISDRNSLETIWKSSFEVDKTFLDFFFDFIFQNSRTYIIRDEDRIISSLTVIKNFIRIDNNDYKGAYIYGVCTLPEYRGNGYSTLLIHEAEHDLKNKGYAFTFLKPADAGLYDFYNKLGYSHVLYHKQEKVTRNELADFQSECTIMNDDMAFSAQKAAFFEGINAIDRIIVLRGTFDHTYIKWPLKAIKMILLYYLSYGYRLVCDEKHYAIVHRSENENNELEILETNLEHYRTDREESLKLNMFLEYLYPDFCSAILNTHAESTLGDRKLVRSGLVKDLGKIKVRNFYLSFPLE